MIYLTPSLSTKLHLSPALWGHMTGPRAWGRPLPGLRWAMDNDVYSGSFNEAGFWRRLKVLQPHRDHCLFVVAPDTVANAIATLAAWRYWGPAIHAAGWPVAFVAQDGQELFDLPPEFDALFIGGSTAWKMSGQALALIAEAKRLGKWVHVGRVNSLARMAHFQLAGVDSVDGTGHCYAPDRYTALYERQLRQRPLFVTRPGDESVK